MEYARARHFIQALPVDISVVRIAELDTHFDFTHSGNSEILAAWFGVAIRTGYRKADTEIERFLLSVGRRKYLSPLYKALDENEETRVLAREIYKKARGNYHSVATSTIDEILKWES